MKKVMFIGTIEDCNELIEHKLDTLREVQEQGLDEELEAKILEELYGKEVK